FHSSSHHLGGDERELVIDEDFDEVTGHDLVVPAQALDVEFMPLCTIAVSLPKHVNFVVQCLDLGAMIRDHAVVLTVGEAGCPGRACDGRRQYEARARLVPLDGLAMPMAMVAREAVAQLAAQL